MTWLGASSLLAALVVGAPPARAGEIHDTVTTSNMSDVFDQALALKRQAPGADVLVAFDTDNTLLVLSQTLGSEQWFEEESRERGTRDFGKLLAVYNAAMDASGAAPTEEDIGAGVAALNAAGVKTMVLTARGPELAQVTAKTLAAARIRLSQTGAVEFPGPRAPVACQAGACLTSGQDKGKALLGFLHAAAVHPAAVIFVDNDPEYPNGNIQRVIDAARAADAPFSLYTYRYSRDNRLLSDYAQNDRSIAVAELIDFRRRGCLGRSCDEVMGDADARAWANANCPARTQAAMQAQMDNLVYGDPIPAELAADVCPQ